MRKPTIETAQFACNAMGDKPHTYMPIVIGDFLKHTAHLSTAAIGAYFLLMMHYWVNGAPADDDATLRRITRSSAREWRVLRPVLCRYFALENGIWRHHRIDRELLLAQGRKLRAQKGSSARWGKNDDAPSIARSDAPSIAHASPEHVLQRCPPSPSTEREKSPQEAFSLSVGVSDSKTVSEPKEMLPFDGQFPSTSIVRPNVIGFPPRRPDTPEGRRIMAALFASLGEELKAKKE